MKPVIAMTAAAQTQKSSRGVPCRSLSGMMSMPCTSMENAASAALVSRALSTVSTTSLLLAHGLLMTSDEPSADAPTAARPSSEPLSDHAETKEPINNVYARHHERDRVQ
jgi:hypothetical protein